MNSFNNPLSFQTVARTREGDYLYSLAEFRELDRSIECARKWANEPKHARKGYFAQVLSANGEVRFDSRDQVPVEAQVLYCGECLMSHVDCVVLPADGRCSCCATQHKLAEVRR